jgi:hypothetical protein
MNHKTEEDLRVTPQKVKSMPGRENMSDEMAENVARTVRKNVAKKEIQTKQLIWISQIVISSSDKDSGWGGVRKMPFVFTEQGVAMLSSVL